MTQAADDPRIKRLLAALRSVDPEPLRELCHPDFTIEEAASLPYAGTYKGFEGMRAVAGAMYASWAECAVTTESVIGNPAGDEFVLLQSMRGLTRRTRRPFEMEILELYTFRDGLLTGIRPFYWDTKALIDLLRDERQIGLGCANFLGASLPELIELAARHGFSSITVRPFAYAQALEAGLTPQGLRRRLSDAGLRATFVDALTSALPGIPPVETLDPAVRAILPPDALNPPNEETCFRCAEALLDVPVLNVVHYRGMPLPLQQMSDAVGSLCQRANARGIRLALEFLPESGLPDLKFTRQVIATTGAPNCAVTFDVFHHDRSGGTVEDVLRLPPGLIANIQLSDRTAPSAGTPHQPFGGRQMPGEGTIPLHELLAAALTNSPDATIDIEVLNPELRSLPVDEAAARLALAARSWSMIL
jgi:sugar phosphate isomerase/epimerase/ketosteroid isomerase-like protein